MAYSDFFDGGKSYTPEYEVEMITNYSGRNGHQRRLKAPGSGGGSIGGGTSGLDAMLAGLDSESEQITDKLRSIYDSYEGGLTEYNDNMQPIIDGLENDLAGLTDWMDGYGELLNEIKPNMVGATKLDPSAARYREEYVGNVASQADQADAATKRQMASQGINPYANAGMARSQNLGRSAAIAGASNQAYRDWRGDYNDDLAQEQAANSQFAELYSKTGDNFQTSVDARTTLAGVTTSVLDNTLEAQRAKAAGYETLYDYNADRRTEALNLGQQQSALQQQSFNNSMTQYNSMDKGWEYFNG